MAFEIRKDTPVDYEIVKSNLGFFGSNYLRARNIRVVRRFIKRNRLMV